MTAAIFTLPEPKTRAEEIQNDLATAALPVAVTYDLVTLPAWLAVGLAGRGIADLGCELGPNAVKDRGASGASGPVSGVTPTSAKPPSRKSK
ncbi:hypothetical protein OJ996_02930 [Luteolibacter sp. GHJ8]|uniref:Uncharacterized protein n=1 Tax=Luteolibacter rhizosphaerae TaxID=2989719 RepID=A0ABT3FZ25_9BACT|nr:hypothetical protein [Luteolibacter rhizosphaerae]MCW1912511.1 hypothetical protein [Luteolibacter rhizosphaerae]